MPNYECTKCDLWICSDGTPVACSCWAPPMRLIEDSNQPHLSGSTRTDDYEFNIKIRVNPDMSEHQQDKWIASCDLLPNVTGDGSKPDFALLDLLDALPSVIEIMFEDGELIFK